MDKKKFLMEVKIYYKGLLSKENDIGHLTLELLIDMKLFMDPSSFVLVETSNSYEVEGERDTTPVGIVKLNCIVSKVVKSENIQSRYDASFNYRLDNGVATFRTKGLNVFVQYGMPIPVEA